MRFSEENAEAVGNLYTLLVNCDSNWEQLLTNPAPKIKMSWKLVISSILWTKRQHSWSFWTNYYFWLCDIILCSQYTSALHSVYFTFGCDLFLTAFFFCSPACKPGYYKAFSGNTKCSKCPQHSSSHDQAATICHCDKGFYRGIKDPASMACTSKNYFK